MSSSIHDAVMARVYGMRAEKQAGYSPAVATSGVRDMLPRRTQVGAGRLLGLGRAKQASDMSKAAGALQLAGPQSGKALKSVAGPLRRYWELLRGGNKSVVGDYNNMFWRLFGQASSAPKPAQRALANRLLQGLTEVRLGGKVGRMRIADGLYANPEALATPEVVKELNKVLATRAATGAGILGLGGAAYGVASKSAEDQAAARLQKMAQWQWAGKAFKPIRRYWTLLRGGDQSVVGGYKSTMRNLAQQSFSSDPAVANLAKARYKAMADARWDRSANHRILRPGSSGDYLPSRNFVSDATVSELNKSLAARGATGVGLTGVGAYGWNKLRGGGQDAPDAPDEGMT